VSGLLPLFILCLGAATAALALWATRQSSTLARRLETAGVGLLSAMVVGFGTPADLSAVFGRDRASSTNPIDVAIVDAGITRESGTSPHFQIAPWVRVENRGRPLDRTMVVFSFYASSGDQVWSTWYGNVPFAGRARKRLSVEWAGEGAGGKVSPGEYRVAAAVTSADQQTIYARVDNVGYVRVVRDTS
jgi:hypothetical protein